MKSLLLIMILCLSGCVTISAEQLAQDEKRDQIEAQKATIENANTDCDLTYGACVK